MFWYVNPVLDEIYKETEATGLLDKMIVSTPIKGTPGANYYYEKESNNYLTNLYRSTEGWFLGSSDGLEYRRLIDTINTLFREKYRVKGEEVLSPATLRNAVVFFGYLLCNPLDQGLDERLSQELDEIVEKIAGPGEKYNTKVFMNTEMFKTILKLLYDPTDIWDRWFGYSDRERSPYNEYTYPPDFFINSMTPLNIQYPYLWGVKTASPIPYFLNWYDIQPLDPPKPNFSTYGDRLVKPKKVLRPKKGRGEKDWGIEFQKYY